MGVVAAAAAAAVAAADVDTQCKGEELAHQDGSLDDPFAAAPGPLQYRLHRNH